MAAPATADSGTHGPDARTIGLSVGALGVVFGDIGTNPLFAMREAFEGHGYELAVFEDNVLGLLSLMFWSLILVICVKYLAFVMRADNRGEGGILALSALVTPKEPPVRGTRWVILLIGLMGAALLHGDGVITPAISVLAAVEGTTIAAPDLDAVVVPAAVAILVGLFMVQHRGTTAIGRVFGPVMVVWFTTIGVLGLVNVADRPGVLRAVNPGHAVSFFAGNGFRGFLVLGAVILVVVRGEALYADMGHFGRRPIVLGWYALVLPSLLLVYFGQGALLIEEPEAIDNPFYRLAPEWGLYPLVVLATIATVIASQALISGAYSLTRQAVQLGYSPRVHHTSATEIGQIYIGAVNWVLMAACVGLVIGFRKSANLAAAYGFAVTTTMVVTTIVFYFVARERFGWSLRLVVPLCVLFLVVDLAFFGATLFKIPDGGWFPLVAAIVVFTLLTTWRTGRRLVRERLVRGGIQLADFVRDVAEDRPVRTPGAGAYLASTPGVTPPHCSPTWSTTTPSTKPCWWSRSWPVRCRASIRTTGPRWPTSAPASTRSRCATASWRTSTCPGRCPSRRRRSWASTSTASRTSWAGSRCGSRPGRGWLAGGNTCSRSCRATPRARPPTSV